MKQRKQPFKLGEMTVESLLKIRGHKTERIEPLLDEDNPDIVALYEWLDTLRLFNALNFITTSLIASGDWDKLPQDLRDDDKSDWPSLVFRAVYSSRQRGRD